MSPIPPPSISPMELQLEPSHRATQGVHTKSTSGIVENRLPDPYSAGPLPSSNTASALAQKIPSLDHDVPSHLATVPEELVRTPRPSADQVEPFHRATLLVLTAPANEKCPAAWSAGPLPSSSKVRAKTAPFTPLPICDQPEPVHLAMPSAATPPAL